MQQEEANKFYERLTSGTKKYETVSIEHESGAVLEGLQVHNVNKRVLARTIERLPEEIFEVAESADDPDSADEDLEQQEGSLNAVTEDTVIAFEDLCKESLLHPELSQTQVRHIIEELSFEVLFRLGSRIIQNSVESTGTIRDFQRQT